MDQCLVPAGGLQRSVAELRKEFDDQRPHRILILDDKNRLALAAPGSDEVAAVFTLGNDQVVRRFDWNGFAKTGIEVLNSTGTLIEPVWMADGRLIGLTKGSDVPSGLYTSEAGEPILVQVDALNTRITAFVEESQDSVVVAAVVPAPPGAGAEGPTFSYLYRIRQ